MARGRVHALVLREWSEHGLQAAVRPGEHADRNHTRDGHAVAGPAPDQVDLLTVLVWGQVEVVDSVFASLLKDCKAFQHSLSVSVRLAELVVCGNPNAVSVSYVRVVNGRVIGRIEIVTTWSLVDAVGAAFEGLGGPHHVDGGS